MRPYLRLVDTVSENIIEPSGAQEQRRAALVEAAVAQYVDCILCEVARISRGSDIIAALILVETARQELERMFQSVKAQT